jgi:glycogen debranching enzyme
VRNGELRYYGTSDATSWFLVLLDATGDRALQSELAGNRAAAAGWLERALDAGGGFVRCGPRHHTGGLQQQGWRDANDPGRDEHGGGIVREDGTPPEPPLADADSQAVAVAALDALSRLDPEDADKWSAMADALRARIQKAFLPEVMALESDDTAVIGAGSQLGWLLWAEVLDEVTRETAVERLSAPDVLTEFGLRTLASSHPAFLAQGYHRGAIWPSDNWLAWGGLRAAGATAAAARVRSGVRRALDQLGHYPELYSVSPLGQLGAVPIANKVQAWTIGAMVAFDLDWDGRPRHGTS